MSDNQFLLIRQRKTNRRVWLEAISCVLIASFLIQEIALANPEAKPLSWEHAQPLKIDFKLPESFGTIEDSYGAPDSKKTFVLIQDAHTNPSGQANVARILECLSEESRMNLRYVFLEAGSGNESLSFLKPYSAASKRKKAAGRLLKTADLQGSEYASLVQDRNWVLWGVEDMRLYVRSVELFRSIVRDKARYADYLDRIDGVIRLLKRRLCNPFLLAFEEERERQKKDEISLAEYLEGLLRKARSEKIPLEFFPHLARLGQLHELERRIDFKKAGEEEAALAALLPEEDRADLEHRACERVSKEFKSGEGFFLALAEKAKDRLSAYPDLAAYLRYVRRASKVDAKKIFQEQKELEKELIARLSENETERRLLQAAEDVDLLKKIFNLTILPEEFGEYTTRRRDFDIRALTGFLNEQLMGLNGNDDKALFLEGGYEKVIRRCREFYALTLTRDERFVENAIKKLEVEGQSQAVLITGGYHTPNLKALLKQRGISFVSITPQVLHETNQKRYEEILLRQDLPASLLRAEALNPPVSANMTRRALFSGSQIGARLAEALSDREGSRVRMFQKIMERKRALGIESDVSDAARAGARFSEQADKRLECGVLKTKNILVDFVTERRPIVQETLPKGFKRKILERNKTASGETRLVVVKRRTIFELLLNEPYGNRLLKYAQKQEKQFEKSRRKWFGLMRRLSREEAGSPRAFRIRKQLDKLSPDVILIPEERLKVFSNSRFDWKGKYTVSSQSSTMAGHESKVFDDQALLASLDDSEYVRVIYGPFVEVVLEHEGIRYVALHRKKDEFVGFKPFYRSFGGRGHFSEKFMKKKKETFELRPDKKARPGETAVIVDYPGYRRIESKFGREFHSGKWSWFEDPMDAALREIEEEMTGQAPDGFPIFPKQAFRPAPSLGARLTEESVETSATKIRTGKKIIFPEPGTARRVWEEQYRRFSEKTSTSLMLKTGFALSEVKLTKEQDRLKNALDALPDLTKERIAQKPWLVIGPGWHGDEIQMIAGAVRREAGQPLKIDCLDIDPENLERAREHFADTDDLDLGFYVGSLLNPRQTLPKTSYTVYANFVYSEDLIDESDWLTAQTELVHLIGYDGIAFIGSSRDVFHRFQSLGFATLVLSDEGGRVFFIFTRNEEALTGSGARLAADGDTLRKWREATHFSLDELSRISGLSRSYISQLEKGQHPKRAPELIPRLLQDIHEHKRAHFIDACEARRVDLKAVAQEAGLDDRGMEEVFREKEHPEVWGDLYAALRKLEGPRLLARIEEFGLTKVEIGKECGLSDMFIGQLAASRTSTTRENWTKIHEAIDRIPGKHFTFALKATRVALQQISERCEIPVETLEQMRDVPGVGRGPDFQRAMDAIETSRFSVLKTRASAMGFSLAALSKAAGYGINYPFQLEREINDPLDGYDQLNQKLGQMLRERLNESFEATGLPSRLVARKAKVSEELLKRMRAEDGVGDPEQFRAVFRAIQNAQYEYFQNRCQAYRIRFEELGNPDVLARLKLTRNPRRFKKPNTRLEAMACKTLKSRLKACRISDVEALCLESGLRVAEFKQLVGGVCMNRLKLWNAVHGAIDRLQGPRLREKRLLAKLRLKGLSSLMPDRMASSATLGEMERGPSGGGHFKELRLLVWEAAHQAIETHLRELFLEEARRHHGNLQKVAHLFNKEWTWREAEELRNELWPETDEQVRIFSPLYDYWNRSETFRNKDCPPAKEVLDALDALGGDRIRATDYLNGKGYEVDRAMVTIWSGALKKSSEPNPRNREYGARLAKDQTPEFAQLDKFSYPEKYFILAPVFNEASRDPKRLAEMIRRAQEGGYVDRLIFVDDASTDASLEMIRSAGMNVVHYDENRQKEGALANAIEFLKEDYLRKGYTCPTYFISLDADSSLSFREPFFSVDEALEGIVGYARKENIVAAGLRIVGDLTRRHIFTAKLQAVMWNFMDFEHRLRKQTRLPGGGVVYHRESFLQAMQSEDVIEAGFKGRPFALERELKKIGTLRHPFAEAVVETKVFNSPADFYRMQRTWYQGYVAAYRLGKIRDYVLLVAIPFLLYGSWPIALNVLWAAGVWSVLTYFLTLPIDFGYGVLAGRTHRQLTRFETLVFQPSFWFIFLSIVYAVYCELFFRDAISMIRGVLRSSAKKDGEPADQARPSSSNTNAQSNVPFSISRATQEDIPAVLMLWKGHFVLDVKKRDSWMDDPIRIAAQESRLRIELQKRIAYPESGLVLIAMSGQRVVGFLTAKGGEEPEIDVCVHREHRGQKIGTSLARVGLDWLYAKGVTQIPVEDYSDGVAKHIIGRLLSERRTQAPNPPGARLAENGSPDVIPSAFREGSSRLIPQPLGGFGMTKVVGARMAMEMNPHDRRVRRLSRAINRKGMGALRDALEGVSRPKLLRNLAALEEVFDRTVRKEPYGLDGVDPLALGIEILRIATECPHKGKRIREAFRTAWDAIHRISSENVLKKMRTLDNFVKEMKKEPWQEGADIFRELVRDASVLENSRTNDIIADFIDANYDPDAHRHYVNQKVMDRIFSFIRYGIGRARTGELAPSVVLGAARLLARLDSINCRFNRAVTLPTECRQLMEDSIAGEDAFLRELAVHFYSEWRPEGMLSARSLEKLHALRAGVSWTGSGWRQKLAGEALERALRIHAPESFDTGAEFRPEGFTEPQDVALREELGVTGLDLERLAADPAFKDLSSIFEIILEDDYEDFLSTVSIDNILDFVTLCERFRPGNVPDFDEARATLIGLLERLSGARLAKTGRSKKKVTKKSTDQVESEGADQKVSPPEQVPPASQIYSARPMLQTFRVSNGVLKQLSPSVDLISGVLENRPIKGLALEASSREKAAQNLLVNFLHAKNDTFKQWIDCGLLEEHPGFAEKLVRMRPIYHQTKEPTVSGETLTAEEASWMAEALARAVEQIPENVKKQVMGTKKRCEDDVFTLVFTKNNGFDSLTRIVIFNQLIQFFTDTGRFSKETQETVIFDALRMSVINSRPFHAMTAVEETFRLLAANEIPDFLAAANQDPNLLGPYCDMLTLVVLRRDLSALVQRRLELIREYFDFEDLNKADKKRLIGLIAEEPVHDQPMEALFDFIFRKTGELVPLDKALVAMAEQGLENLTEETAGRLDRLNYEFLGQSIDQSAAFLRAWALALPEPDPETLTYGEQWALSELHKRKEYLSHVNESARMAQSVNEVLLNYAATNQSISEEDPKAFFADLVFILVKKICLAQANEEVLAGFNLLLSRIGRQLAVQDGWIERARDLREKISRVASATLSSQQVEGAAMSILEEMAELRRDRIVEKYGTKLRFLEDEEVPLAIQRAREADLASIKKWTEEWEGIIRTGQRQLPSNAQAAEVNRADLEMSAKLNDAEKSQLSSAPEKMWATFSDDLLAWQVAPEESVHVMRRRSKEVFEVEQALAFWVHGRVFLVLTGSGLDAYVPNEESRAYEAKKISVYDPSRPIYSNPKGIVVPVNHGEIREALLCPNGRIIRNDTAIQSPEKTDDDHIQVIPIAQDEKLIERVAEVLYAAAHVSGEARDKVLKLLSVDSDREAIIFGVGRGSGHPVVGFGDRKFVDPNTVLGIVLDENPKNDRVLFETRSKKYLVDRKGRAVPVSDEDFMIGGRLSARSGEDLAFDEQAEKGARLSKHVEDRTNEKGTVSRTMMLRRNLERYSKDAATDLPSVIGTLMSAAVIFINPTMGLAIFCLFLGIHALQYFGHSRFYSSGSLHKVVARSRAEYLTQDEAVFLKKMRSGMPVPFEFRIYRTVRAWTKMNPWAELSVGTITPIVRSRRIFVVIFDFFATPGTIAHELIHVLQWATGNMDKPLVQPLAMQLRTLGPEGGKLLKPLSRFRRAFKIYRREMAELGSGPSPRDAEFAAHLYQTLFEEAFQSTKRNVKLKEFGEKNLGRWDPSILSFVRNVPRSPGDEIEVHIKHFIRELSEMENGPMKSTVCRLIASYYRQISPLIPLPPQLEAGARMAKMYKRKRGQQVLLRCGEEETVLTVLYTSFHETLLLVSEKFKDDIEYRLRPSSEGGTPSYIVLPNGAKISIDYPTRAGEANLRIEADRDIRLSLPKIAPEDLDDTRNLVLTRSFGNPDVFIGRNDEIKIKFVGFRTQPVLRVVLEIEGASRQKPQQIVLLPFPPEPVDVVAMRRIQFPRPRPLDGKEELLIGIAHPDIRDSQQNKTRLILMSPRSVSREALPIRRGEVSHPQVDPGKNGARLARSGPARKVRVEGVTYRVPSARQVKEINDAFDSNGIYTHPSGAKILLGLVNRSLPRQLILEALVSAYGEEQDILSIGSGQGHNEKILKILGRHRVQGVDLSQKQARRARGRGIPTRIADAHALPDFGKKFDLALFSESIGQMHLETVLREAKKQLKKGGHVLITTYDHAERNLEKEFELTQYIPYKPKQILRALKKTGFHAIITYHPVVAKDAEGNNIRMFAIIARNPGEEALSPEAGARLGKRKDLRNRLKAVSETIEKIASRFDFSFFRLFTASIMGIGSFLLVIGYGYFFVVEGSLNWGVLVTAAAALIYLAHSFAIGEGTLMDLINLRNQIARIQDLLTGRPGREQSKNPKSIPNDLIPGAIDIREAKSGDLNELAQMEERNFEFPWTYDEILEAWKQMTSTELLERKLLVARGVTRSDRLGPIAGSACLFFDEDLVRIESIAVDQPYRLQGIGRKMVDRIKRICAETGKKRIEVLVRETNEDALKFFKKMGFEDSRLAPHPFTQVPEDGVLFAWTLPEQEDKGARLAAKSDSQESLIRRFTGARLSQEILEQIQKTFENARVPVLLLDGPDEKAERAIAETLATALRAQSKPVLIVPVDVLRAQPDRQAAMRNFSMTIRLAKTLERIVRLNESGPTGLGNDEIPAETSVIVYGHRSSDDLSEWLPVETRIYVQSNGETEPEKDLDSQYFDFRLERQNEAWSLRPSNAPSAVYSHDDFRYYLARTTDDMLDACSLVNTLYHLEGYKVHYPDSFDFRNSSETIVVRDAEGQITACASVMVNDPKEEGLRSGGTGSKIDHEAQRWIARQPEGTVMEVSMLGSLRRSAMLVLFKMIFRYAKARGIKHLFMTVNPNHSDVYARIGFIPIGPETEYVLKEETFYPLTALDEKIAPYLLDAPAEIDGNEIKFSNKPATALPGVSMFMSLPLMDRKNQEGRGFPLFYSPDEPMDTVVQNWAAHPQPNKPAMLRAVKARDETEWIRLPGLNAGDWQGARLARKKTQGGYREPYRREALFRAVANEISNIPQGVTEISIDAMIRSLASSMKYQMSGAAYEEVSARVRAHLDGLPDRFSKKTDDIYEVKMGARLAKKKSLSAQKGSDKDQDATAGLAEIFKDIRKKLEAIKEDHDLSRAPEMGTLIHLINDEIVREYVSDQLQDYVALRYFVGNHDKQNEILDECLRVLDKLEEALREGRLQTDAIIHLSRHDETSKGARMAKQTPTRAEEALRSIMRTGRVLAPTAENLISIADGSRIRFLTAEDRRFLTRLSRSSLGETTFLIAGDAESYRSLYRRFDLGEMTRGKMVLSDEFGVSNDPRFPVVILPATQGDPVSIGHEIVHALEWIRDTEEIAVSSYSQVEGLSGRIPGLGEALLDLEWALIYEDYLASEFFARLYGRFWYLQLNQGSREMDLQTYRDLKGADFRVLEAEWKEQGTEHDDLDRAFDRVVDTLHSSPSADTRTLSRILRNYYTSSFEHMLPLPRLLTSSTARSAGRSQTVRQTPRHRGARLSNQIHFVARAYRASSRSDLRHIEIGQTLFRVRKRNDRLEIYAYGKRMDVPGGRLASVRGDSGTVEVGLSMTDFQLLLQKTFAVGKKTFTGARLAKKAVAVVDLDALGSNLKGFEELTVPVLVREVKHFAQSAEGKSARILVTGARLAVESVRRQAENFPALKNVLVFDETGLGEYADAPRAMLTTPQGRLSPGMRHFFIASMRVGALPNLRVALPGTVSLARLDNLDTDLPSFKGWFEAFLGREISNLGEWRAVISGEIQNPSSVEWYALPHVTVFALNDLIRGARLACKMIEQSA